MRAETKASSDSSVVGPSFYERTGKRVVDLMIAVAVALVSAPFALALAVLIRTEDGGPAIFSQERVGKDGRAFTLRKFRTMPVNTAQVPSSEASTLRVTRIGKMLRRTSLDEIPQIMSVISGNMSLVGPRPPLACQMGLIEMRRTNGALRLRPGLTGLAQVNAYDGMSEKEKAAWDGCYARQVTLLQDVRVAVCTFGYLLNKPPRY